jgi:hypothetical protein
VVSALNATGISPNFGHGWIDRGLGLIRGLPRPVALSLRNTVLRKGRLALTLTTLILAAAVVMGVILTAPMPFGRTSATTADDERREWTARLAASLRAVMIVLYGVAAFAKFNDGWFDPQYSCSVLMAACALGDLMPLSPALLRLMPLMALAFEVSMPLVILGAELAELYGPYESERLARCVRTVRRVCVLLGSVFHIVIALPPPPVSVYPFSMLMAPIFVGLVPAECAAAARAAEHAPRPPPPSITYVANGHGRDRVSARADFECAGRRGRAVD